MFVDMTPALIMLVPMLIPLTQKLGIDMVHLGLVMVINLAFGLTTPPVGTALFVATCRRRWSTWIATPILCGRYQSVSCYSGSPDDSR